MRIVEKEKDLEAASASEGHNNHATRHPMGTGVDHQHGSAGVVDSALTKIVGVGILEFGVLLHRSVTSFVLLDDTECNVKF